MSDATPTLADLQRELNGWRAGLLLSSKNAPKPLLANALIALRATAAHNANTIRRFMSVSSAP
jgi:hypothetical protein